MGRKHGFKGTPVRPPRGPGTIGRVFEQRGDPMVSAREGREKYGRNLDNENADLDADEQRKVKEHEAKERLWQQGLHQFREPSKPEKKDDYDPQRAAANIVMKMDADMRKAMKPHENKPKTSNPHVIKGSFYYFPDQTDKLHDCPTHPPEPVLGSTTAKGFKEKKR